MYQLQCPACDYLAKGDSPDACVRDGMNHMMSIHAMKKEEMTPAKMDEMKKMVKKM